MLRPDRRRSFIESLESTSGFWPFREMEQVGYLDLGLGDVFSPRLFAVAASGASAPVQMQRIRDAEVE